MRFYSYLLIRQPAMENQKNPKVTLRAVEPEDVDRMYIWENDPELWPCGIVHAPLSRHQLWEYANSADFNPLTNGQLRMIIEVEDEGEQTAESGRDVRNHGLKIPCGTIDLYDVDARNGRAFVGIMLTREFRGKGIASEALESICKYAREALGLRLLAAEISADNLSSLNLFRRARFEQMGARPDWFLRPTGFVPSLEFLRKL